MKELDVLNAFSPQLFVIMAGSIKLFLFIQKMYQTVGIYDPGKNQNHLFNSKCVFFSTFSAEIFILMVICAVTEAQSIPDIAIGFYLSATSLMIAFIYLSSIFLSAKIYGLIGKIEEFIEQSKFQLFCSFNSGNIQKKP